MGMAFIARDGSSPDARVQLVAGHRPGFTAGLDLQYARAWCDTVPAPDGAHASSELLSDDLHAPTPRVRAMQVRHLGAICLITFVAIVCFALPLAAHFTAKAQAPQPTHVPTLGATG